MSDKTALTNPLAELEAAIVRLQNGERVASVAYGDQAVKYERVELRDLIRLRDRLRAECAHRRKNAKRRIVMAMHRGLRDE